MRAMIFLTFLLASIKPLAVHAQSSHVVFDEHTLREECNNAYFSQIEVRECLEQKAKISERALTQAEEKLNAAFATWDVDDKYVTLSKSNLSESTKIFNNYRKAQCELSASLGGAAIGTALQLRRLACIAELNNRRAAQLRGAAADLNKRTELLRAAGSGLPSK